MRIGGVGTLSDGRIAVCTLMGDVWIVSGIDKTLKRLVWKRFASGLNQPLGLVVKDDQIHVIGRDQLTRLHDTNDDGEADFYECLTNEFPTARGNSFALTLHLDKPGPFLLVHSFFAVRYDPLHTWIQTRSDRNRSAGLQWHRGLPGWFDCLRDASGRNLATGLGNL